MSLPLDSLTAEHFEPRIGSSFRLGAAGAALDLLLASVQPHGPARRAGGGFSLGFVSAPGPCLPQAIYPLADDHLGVLHLFLVPVGPVEGGNGYEAVFA